MTTAATPLPAARTTGASGFTFSSDWPLHAVLFSSACIVIGLLWDISWHKTVGRDTFWTLPHLLEQLGAVVAGVSCGWLVLSTTFRKAEGREGGRTEALNQGTDWRAASVRFWGFHGPLGAWVTIWGTFVMIISAPFDNWWHNAYGLDVKIVSPPHMVLAMGMIAIQIGAMLMLLAAQNRAQNPREVRRLGWAFAFAGGVLLTMVATMISEYASRANDMHSTLFYQVAGGALPLFLVAFARSGRLGLPATTAAAVYMAITLGMMWILQLFPAQPKLAPIYTAVTHMVPPEFPLLLVIPAFAIDLLLSKSGRRHDWLMAVAVGLAFVAVLAAVQWYFGVFLLSPAANNFVFAGDQWAYMVRPGNWQHEFWNTATDPVGNFSLPVLARGLGIATLIAIGSARLGLWCGNGMSRVVR